jgi:DNA-binding NarL/FixJ family response regulator
MMVKRKILIADDHAMIRDGVKSLLRQNKEYVIAGEAVSGRQAIDKFNELQPDLLILDISMPDMNGMEVSKTILEQDIDANIIILSMYDDEDYITRCMELGVKGYVIKNESGNELDHAIKSVLNGKTYFSNQVQQVIFKKYSQNVARKKEKQDLIKPTKREVEIIKLISEGLTSQEMADRLFISLRTVETHRGNLLKKLGVKNAVELIRKAQQMELI